MSEEGNFEMLSALGLILLVVTLIIVLVGFRVSAATSCCGGRSMSKLVLTRRRAGASATVDGGRRLRPRRCATGEFVSLLGPSGCGKTTTLRMIAGFIDPTAGTIEMDGQVLSSPTGVAAAREARHVDDLPELRDLAEHDGRARTSPSGSKLRKLPRDGDRAPRRRDPRRGAAGPPRATRYPAELSGGQQQRVALARAIVVEPEVLLLDEPLSNLDANLREEMRFEIRRLHDEFRITTVYVTHDQAEAMVTSDRIAVMNQGRIEQVDAPHALYTRPQTRFVAGFIGRTNFIEGTAATAQVEFGAVRDAGRRARTARRAGKVTFSVRPQSMRLSRAQGANGAAAGRGDDRRARLSRRVLGLCGGAGRRHDASAGHHAAARDLSGRRERVARIRPEADDADLMIRRSFRRKREMQRFSSWTPGPCFSPSLKLRQVKAGPAEAFWRGRVAGTSGKACDARADCRRRRSASSQRIDARLAPGSSSGPAPMPVSNTRTPREMRVTPRLYIGTAGLSVWYSDDLGETLQRFWGTSGMYSETRVWALAAHPQRPGELLAGTDSGIYRLDIAGGKWTHLPSPMDSLCIWSVARSPHDPDLILAGTRPPGIFRSTDGAKTWERVKAPLPETCPAVMKPRVTQITFDPDDPDLVFAGLEIGGVWRSTDRRQDAFRAPPRGWCPRTSTASRWCATARGWSMPPPIWACMSAATTAGRGS